MRVAILPLARATFDVAYAQQKLAGMLALLDASGHQTVGPRELLTEPEPSRQALAALVDARPDVALVMQVTFTDAAFVLEAASALDVPLALWAPREPRAGGRLRLNAFCGLNLVAHALGRAGRRFSWLYADPEEAEIAAALAELLAGERLAAPAESLVPDARPLELNPLEGRRVVRIGSAPEGFVTCAYGADDVARRFGAEVATHDLAALFAEAREVGSDAVAPLRERVADGLDGLDAVDQGELDRSLRLKLALDAIAERTGTDAFALRCWPETFTEYGGAACGPAAMLGEARLPCACEADVWGALTQLALQALADAPVFLVDLVDVDADDDTAVVWHCGQAPPSMAAATPRATIHTNRRMPLLYEFALRPGRVTFLRLSQARGEATLVMASGTMLHRPMAFTGTSGVVRFDAPAERVLARLMGSALEHHMALAYGDHGASLQRLAATLGLPVIELTREGTA